MIVEFEGFKFNKKKAIYQKKLNIEKIISFPVGLADFYVESTLGKALRNALEVSDFVKVRKVSEEE